VPFAVRISWDITDGTSGYVTVYIVNYIAFEWKIQSKKTNM
jgi:hypothetical protein